MRRLLLPSLAISGALVLAAAVGMTTAGAHQSPAGCDSKSVDITPTRDKLVVRNGDVINYKVSIRNVDRDAQKACDLTDATVTFTLPAADGTPTGTKVTLASGAGYPVGTSTTFPDPIPWTVAVNPGVVDAVVEATITGTLHDAPTDHAANIRKTLGTTVTQPHTTLTASAAPANGQAPLPVTFTYLETNDSTTDAPITGVAINDPNCSPVTYQSGDTGDDKILSKGETWTLTCSTTLQTPGVVTSNIVGKGTATVDNRPVDDELTSVSVTVEAAPARPIAAAELPKTGAGTLPLFQFALGSVATGVAFRTAGRRRR